MKKFLLMAIVIAFASSLKSQSVDTVFLESGITNQGYYSLLNGIQENDISDDWDVAFQTLTAFSTSIMINPSNGTELYEYPGDTSDWSTFDTTGMSTWTQRFNSDTSWNYGAFSQDQVGFDVGWGKYNQNTHEIIGDKLYVMKLGNGIYQKVWIKSLISGVYTFRHATLNGSMDMSHTLDKSTYSGKNFGYFSFQTHSAKDKEPLAEDWDLYFGKYTAFVPTAYTVTGVLHSAGTESSKVYPVNDPANYIDWQANPLMTEINTIGYEWKNYDFQNNQYVIEDSTVYFIRTQLGDVFKVIFTHYGWDAVNFNATGEIVFNKEHVHFAGVDDESTLSLFDIYPNPAEDFFTLAYNIESRTTMELVDLSGKTVLKQDLPRNQLAHTFSVSNLKSGLYILVLSSENERITEKLMVK